MTYSKKVQKAKANRSDHRKARATAGSINRTALKRDSKKFKSLEREHDPRRRFGGSLKSVYFDSDGDGYKDTYGRVYRSGAIDKPGAEIPTFGHVVPPVFGPTNLLAAEILSAPASGPSSLIASIVAPANGPTELGASVKAPSNGPTGLGASVNAPAEGPTVLGASVIAPAEGPTGLNAAEVFTAPANGPTGLSATKLTLNINIEASQETIVAKTPAIGTIEYASDIQHLFIYDGTEWHRTDGGNS